MNWYHHLLFLFRNSCYDYFFPSKWQERDLINARNVCYSPCYPQQILHLGFFLCCDQIELMWLGDKAPDRSPSSNQNKMPGELHVLTFTTKSDCFHKVPYAQFPVLSSACGVYASLFALPNALQKTGHYFKLLRSCPSEL